MRLVQAVLLLAVTASPAFAQREPEIVIPGKAGVPVYINGVDASWGVVIGEFGLDRPGLMAPTVIYRPLVVCLAGERSGLLPQVRQEAWLWSLGDRAAGRSPAAGAGADLFS